MSRRRTTGTGHSRPDGPFTKSPKLRKYQETDSDSEDQLPTEKTKASGITPTTTDQSKTGGGGLEDDDQN